MSPAERPVVVGIDLGTTYSLVAALLDGAPRVLPGALGELLTPSAVSVTDEGMVLVGAAARARAATHPESTALCFKRDMGTERLYPLGALRLGPQELSALVLRQLKEDAEAALGRPVEEAVVTVPAYFGDAQRQATKDAGAIAGLRVERIINEPTAAALAYGLHSRQRELRAAVLDLGGGTFDVTVLEIMEGVIEIRGSAGDARLGGVDFDGAILDHLGARLRRERGFDVSESPLALGRLREAVERARRLLSSEELARLHLPALPVGGGRQADVELTLTRAEAEGLFVPLLERMRGPIRRALGDAGLAPERIDEVLLVGGATRMPCVARLGAQVFGRMPLRTLPPDEAVALGAAVQAGLKVNDAAVSDLVVTDIAPMSLGIESTRLVGGRHLPGVFSPLLERGTVLPASREGHFHTIADDQTELHLNVYQGEHSLCRDNQLLGGYVVTGLPPRPAGEEGVVVRFTYDMNGILEVDVTVKATGRTETLVIERAPGRLTPAQVAAAREAMARLKVHPRELLPNVTLLARAEARYQELTGAAREEVAAALAAFRVALEEQDRAEIDQARRRLSRLV